MEGDLWKRLSQHIKACFGNAADQIVCIIYPMFVLGDSYVSEFLFYIIYKYLYIIYIYDICYIYILAAYPIQ